MFPLKQPLIPERLPKFSVGQPVTSSMHIGVFAVHRIVEMEMCRTVFYRYILIQHDKFVTDVPEVWLTAARFRHPVQAVIGNGKLIGELP